MVPRGLRMPKACSFTWPFELIEGSKCTTSFCEPQVPMLRTNFDVVHFFCLACDTPRCTYSHSR